MLYFLFVDLKSTKKYGRYLLKMADKKGGKEKAETKSPVKENIDDKESKIKELTNGLQRLQAEFENYKKRVEKEKFAFIQFANEELIVRILPIIDSFELALQNTNSHEEFVKGVKLIYTQLFSMLESLGVKKINAQGSRFDPYKHEVLTQEKSDKEEGTIIEELQKGYLLGDKVIRHAKVKISKGG